MQRFNPVFFFIRGINSMMKSLKQLLILLFVILLCTFFMIQTGFSMMQSSGMQIGSLNEKICITEKSSVIPGVEEDDDDDEWDDDDDDWDADDDEEAVGNQVSPNELTEQERALLARKDIEARLNDIQLGKSGILDDIYYQDLQNLLDFVIARAKNRKTNPVIELTKNFEARKEVRHAFLEGLQNKDPRVRLSSIIVLKNIGLNPDMQKEVRKVLYVESVQSSSYVVKNLEGKTYRSTILEDLNKLDKLITRQIMSERLKSGSLSSEDFSTMSSDLILPLIDTIEQDEPKEAVPIRTLKDREVDFLIAGLNNKNLDIKTRCAERLSAIYYNPQTLGIVKSLIEKHAEQSYILRNQLKEDYSKYVQPKEPAEEDWDDDDDDWDDDDDDWDDDDED